LLSGCIELTTSEYDSITSGLIHFALAVNYGSNLAMFAIHVWQISFERAELVEGFVSRPEGVAYTLH
jgi:hypothetical protein